MAFIPVPNAAYVRLHYKVGDVLTASIGFWFTKEGFGVEDMNDLLDDIAANFCNTYKASCAEVTTLNRLEAYDMRAPDGYHVVKNISIDGAKTGLPPLSPATSLCVSFKNSKRGPWNRGRAYCSGFAEEDADEMDWESNVTTNILAAFQSLIDTPPTGWTWVICSKIFNGEPRATGLCSAVTEVLINSTRFAIQKRRARHSQGSPPAP
jgi:hypothetical protein